MLLELHREPPFAEAMLGVLRHDGLVVCQTLEDVPRTQKIAGKTAIPAGEYEIIINWSNRFKQRMPLLLGVPNFEGVRIHAGNTHADTEGCILVGMLRGENTILESRRAYKRVFALIDEALRREKTKIRILDP